jgi:hypothetical protein
MFQLHPSVEYHVGPVGQDTLAAAPHRDSRTSTIGRFLVRRDGALPSLGQLSVGSAGR